MRSVVHQVVKNTSFLTIAEVVTKGLSFFLTIIIARYLGDVGFGKYSFALAFTSLFSVLSDCGFSTLTIREVARDNSLAQKYFENGSFIKIILAIATFIVIAIAINIMKYPKDTLLAVYIAGAYTIITSFNQFLQSIFRAFEKMEFEALTRVFEMILVLVLVEVVIYLKYSVIIIISCYFVGSLFRLVISMVIVVKKFIKPTLNFDSSFLKDSFKEAIPFGISGIFVLIYFKIDTVMLSSMKGDTVVGWYNAAYQLIFGLMLVSNIIVGSIVPIMSKYYKKSKSNLKKIFIYTFTTLLIISIPILIAGYYFSNNIIIAIYSEDYLESANALKVLIFVIPILFLTSLLGPTLESMNKQRTVSMVAGLNALFNLILNFLLIPTYSYTGAAFATVVTEALGMVMMGTMLWKIFKANEYNLKE